MSDQVVLALFAKAPRPGQVKTRLCPPFTPEEAADLYRAMLLDICDQHLATEKEVGTDLALWFAPPDEARARDWFESHVPGAYALHPQRGSDLAARMRSLFQVHASEGYARILLRGTDSPTLPASRISDALAALDDHDLVLCPDRDGGYNLIGLREPQDRLFDLEMSTGSVLDWTVDRARALGLATALLPPHHDVDTAADLALLVRELDAETTPRTKHWLASCRVKMTE